MDYTSQPEMRLAADPFDEELIELLRAEVSYLQSELIERDARLAELSAVGDAGPASDLGMGDDALASQTETLLDHLESMLEELSESDRRVKTLEQLLRAAEEATEAEREERRQIGAWIDDIESRFTGRENEWQAEIESLQNRLRTLAGGPRTMPVQTDSADATRQEHEELLRDLRQRLADSEQKLVGSERVRCDLERRIESANVEDMERACRERIEGILREERLHLAEEHTELARLRAELTRATAEIVGQTQAAQRVPDAVTTQIHTLRQHLRDIHEEEKRDREERRLSSRIARLWKRIEG